MKLDMRRIKREIVGAIVMNFHGEILLGRRPDTSPGVYPGCWLAPGGGIEDGETHLAALQRELSEEIGLPKDCGEYSLLDDQGQGTTVKTLKTGETVTVEMVFFMYSVQLPRISWTPTPSDEFAELRWFSRGDLRSIKLSPPGAELFSRLKWL